MKTTSCKTYELSPGLNYALHHHYYVELIGKNSPSFSIMIFKGLFHNSKQYDINGVNLKNKKQTNMKIQKVCSQLSCAIWNTVDIDIQNVTISWG